MKRTGCAVAIFTITTILTTGARAFAQDAPSKPTLAIADVAVSPGGWTLPPPQLGSAIIELLIDELVSSRQFHVYDGQWLVPESEVGGRVNLQRLRDAAAIRHVDYVVLGTVTAFATEHSRKHGGGILPRPFVVGGISREQMQTSVAVAFKVVDVRTGEIVTTSTAQGTGVRRASSVGLLGMIRGVPLPVAAAAASRMPNARDAMLNEAIRNAVHDAAHSLELSAPRLVSGDDEHRLR